MITYQFEKWADYYRDCQELWVEHYKEFEPMHHFQMPMSPDIEMYEYLEKIGKLQILTIRKEDAMIGYCLLVNKRHPHYNTICGFEDSYYLKQNDRKGMAGVKLISLSIKQAKKNGAQRVYFFTKEFINVSKILEHQGMEKCDSVYSIWTGDQWA